jgi:dynactin-6
VHSTITIGSNCIIGPGCTVTPLSVPTSAEWASLDLDVLGDAQQAEQEQEEEQEPKEHLEDYTVVYGANNERRIWSGEGKGQQIALMHKHLAYLTEMLPKYSRLKLIT